MKRLLLLLVMCRNPLRRSLQVLCGWKVQLMMDMYSIIILSPRRVHGPNHQNYSDCIHDRDVI